eukprot:15464399-Alexandrium_andersonii.AAC.1
MEDYVADPPEPPPASSRSTLRVPGIQHIVHNVCSGLSDRLVHFQDRVSEGMRNLAQMLAHRWSRERFVASCLVGGPFEVWKPLFEAAGPNLIEWRWASLANVAAYLLSLKTPLQVAWSKQKYGASGADAPAGGARQVTTVKAEAVDVAVQSPFFWAYLGMLDSLASAVHLITVWSESCPCHWDLAAVVEDTKRKRRSSFQQRLNLS